jgi:hypothetical protein
MDNPGDDPREFGHDPLEDTFGRGGIGNPDNFLGALSTLLGGLPGPRSPSSPGSPGSAGTSPFGGGFVFSSHRPVCHIPLDHSSIILRIPRTAAYKFKLVALVQVDPDTLLLVPQPMIDLAAHHPCQSMSDKLL